MRKLGRIDFVQAASLHRHPLAVALGAMSGGVHALDGGAAVGEIAALGGEHVVFDDGLALRKAGDEEVGGSISRGLRLVGTMVGTPPLAEVDRLEGRRPRVLDMDVFQFAVAGEFEAHREIFAQLDGVFR